MERIDIVVRAARRGDAAQLAELYFASRIANIPAIPPPIHSLDEIRQWIADVVLVKCAVDIAADRDGNPVGFIAVDGNEVSELYVAPGWTGRGVGSVLLRGARAGRSELELWAFQSNSGAIRFYERHGFHEVRRTAGENEERAPDVLLAWADGRRG